MRTDTSSTDSSFTVVAHLIVMLTGVLTGCIATQSAAQSPQLDVQTMLVDPAAVNPDIPAPMSVIGHEIGDGAVRYDPAVRYLRTWRYCSARGDRASSRTEDCVSAEC